MQAKRGAYNLWLLGTSSAGIIPAMTSWDQSFQQGVTWLLAQQNPNGDFCYSRQVVSAKPGLDNNIVRQAGALYALAHAYHYAPQPQLAKTLTLGWQYFLSQSQTENNRTWIQTGPVIKTNATSLVILSLLEAQEAGLRLSQLQKRWLNRLINFVLSCQRSDGSFIYSSKNPIKRSDFNDAEAFYVLSRVDKTNFLHYQGASKRSLSYIQSTYQEGNWSTPAYAWTMAAIRHSSFDIRHSLFPYAQAYTQAVWNQRLFPMLEGKTELSAGHASHAEGLGQILHLAKDVDNAWFKLWKSRLEAVLTRLQTLQLGNPACPRSNYHSALTGAFLSKAGRQTVRIDITQHNLSAVYLYLDLKLPEWICQKWDLTTWIDMSKIGSMSLVRHSDQPIQTHFSHYREVMVLLGARQVGKTTLLRRLFPEAVYWPVDNEPIRQNLERYDQAIYRQLLSPKTTFLVIDEIQRLSDPGRAAKIFYDQFPDLHLIITGSSALNLKNRTTESLAGRKIDYHLYPLSFSEYMVQKEVEDHLNWRIFENISNPILQPIVSTAHLFDLTKTLEQILIYGQYPNILTHPQDTLYLTNLADSLVFKDILELYLIESKAAALNLLKLLAHQIGQLVNYADLSNRLNLDIKTVKRYIEIFEKSFLIYRLYPFSLNGRDEIGKNPKIYFFDTGLRNALIQNFLPSIERTDMGALFENFLITEVLKANQYLQAGYSLHYWRTKQGSEVDLILKRDQTLLGVEIKFKARRPNQAFKNRYPQAVLKMITSETFYTPWQS